MHDLDFDHYHEFKEEERELVGEAIWNADNLALTTVGVDVGSSTSHVMFARVHLKRMAEALSSRFVVVVREILWRSPIRFTPYRANYTIDADELRQFIETCYREAGLKREDIDSGAVILTGEALKRTNARAIADLFADQSGKFVCASAGHHLEALMAAHGSGAVDLSRTQHKTFLNVDIGGGTTKLALLHGGQLLGSAAIAVGGRLIAFDDAGRMTRIEDPVRQVADAIGLHLALGDVLTPACRSALIAQLVDILVQTIRLEAADPLAAELLVTAPLRRDVKIDAITFSGGVSEYIYGRETADYGDLGRDLARGITSALAKKQIAYPVSDPGQGIRATAVGASQFTVQVSGNTNYVSDPEALPIRNLPVLTLADSLDGVINPIAIRDQIVQALVRFDIDEADTTVALAFKWGGDPSHARLHAFAAGICLGLADAATKGRPIVLVSEGDISNNLGRLLVNELDVKGTVVSLDGLQLREFDYVDIGELSQPANVVPVVIKSLLFAAPDQSADAHHHHHGDGPHHHHPDHAHGPHHHTHD